MKSKLILASLLIAVVAFSSVAQAAPTAQVLLKYVGSNKTGSIWTQLNFNDAANRTSDWRHNFAVAIKFDPGADAGAATRDISNVTFSFTPNSHLTSVLYSSNTKNWRPASGNYSYEDPDLGPISGQPMFASDDGDAGTYNPVVGGFGTTSGTDLQAIFRNMGKATAFYVQPGEAGNTPNPDPNLGVTISPTTLINLDGSLTIGNVWFNWDGQTTDLLITGTAGANWTSVEGNANAGGTLVGQSGLLGDVYHFVPEPMTMALLSIGGLAAIIRRRK